MGSSWKSFDSNGWKKLTMCYTTGDIWGVKNDGSLFFREGCNDDNIFGTGWKQLTGRNILDIDCAYRGRLYYIAKAKAGMLKDVDEEHPMGQGWLDTNSWKGHLEVRGNSDGSAIYSLKKDFNV